MMFCLSRALLVLTLALNLSACNFFDDEPIRVGFLGTLSGPNNFLGTSARDGALLAVAEANQQGGINGPVWSSWLYVMTATTRRKLNKPSLS